jgi:ligand-binding sensor domain-containing protein
MIYFLEKYFLFLMLLFLPMLYAQTNKIRFEHLTTDNGLSSNHISYILQDKKGFLWICTQDGINRFDGYNFKHYKHISGNKNSLSDFAASHIFEDSEGLFWISTRDGLNVFDPVEEKYFL